jgi:hypothetical protein
MIEVFAKLQRAAYQALFHLAQCYISSPSGYHANEATLDSVLGQHYGQLLIPQKLRCYIGVCQYNVVSVLSIE